MSDHETDARRLSAALRLKHDLGKYVRLGAPDEPENDPEELRSRLHRDLAETRRTPEGTESAVEVFDAWRRDEQALFVSEPELGAHLRGVGDAVDEVRRLLPRLDALTLPELRRLDEASHRIANETRALHRRTAELARSGATATASKGA